MSVETSGITKYFGTQKALDAVSFHLKKGELVGFLGPNGAGKSTLMKIITGFLPADEGKVLVNGLEIVPEHVYARKKIGYLPENNPLYTDLYVRESLEITAGFYSLNKVQQRVMDMLDLTGLGREQHKKIGALSKGYRQRVGLAQALIHDPEVLILDEPTTGLDPNQLEEIRGLIRTISREKTVMLSSHIMQEVEAVCNRVIIINHGHIVADGSMEAVKTGELKRSQVVIAGFNQAVESNKLLHLPGVAKVALQNNNYELEALPGVDIRPVVFRFAVDNNLTLLTLHEKQQNLEGIFQALTR